MPACLISKHSGTAVTLKSKERYREIITKKLTSILEQQEHHVPDYQQQPLFSEFPMQEHFPLATQWPSSTVVQPEIKEQFQE